MKDNLYAKACTEVLEILSHFSEEDFSKIPSDKIEFFEKNKDKDYEYKIDPDVDLSKQYISDEANAIIVGFNSYFNIKSKATFIASIIDFPSLSRIKAYASLKRDITGCLM